MEQYSLIVAGGTFDNFHKGHEEFLRFLLKTGKKVLLGITDDAFAKAKVGEVGSFAQRKETVEKFLQKEHTQERIEIKPIKTIFIPEEWKRLSIEAIVVTEETKQGADIINQQRKQEGLAVLKIVVAPKILAGDGKNLSASRIRRGEINTEGRPYIKTEWLTRTLRLPEEMRSRLQSPFGDIISDPEKWISEYGHIKEEDMATVGDVTTKMFHEIGFRQRISIVDLNVARHKAFEALSDLGFSDKEQVITVKNPNGFITPTLFSACKKVFEKTNNAYVIQVDGEEDLAVLPLVLSAPLGFTIFYGQPNQGVVLTAVTPERKNEAYNIISSFV